MDLWFETDLYDLGEHSFSWVTLTDLVEYFEAHPGHQQAAGDFYDEVLPELIGIAQQHGLRYDQLRCVLGFDS